MTNRIELVEAIGDLIKNGINMDGCNIFECNLFMKELHDFINTQTGLSAHYKDKKVTIESIFFDPLLSVELDKTTIQCIPITDEGWIDALFEVLKFMHIKEISERLKEAERLKKERESNKELDWI